LQAERITDRSDVIAGFQCVGIPESDLAQALGLDLDDGDVGLRVAADQLGREFTLIGERDRDVAGIFDDVGVGDDVALLCVDHDTGAS